MLWCDGIIEVSISSHKTFYINICNVFILGTGVLRDFKWQKAKPVFKKA